jgi:hypothetical protein
VSQHNRERRWKRDEERRSFVTIQIKSSFSNDEIIDCLRHARDFDRPGRKVFIVCQLDGFNDDPRELHQIPEARALAKRAWDLGLGSYLEVTTSLDPPKELMDSKAFALGAFELYHLGYGNLRDSEGGGASMTITPDEFRHWVETELITANQRADQLLGDAPS